MVRAHELSFVASYGSEWPDIDRQEAVCAHTVLREDLLLIEDVHEDPRFASTDALIELGLRAYLGAPLVTPGGHAIGTFCVCDHRPRRFTDDVCRALTQFAEEAMEQLELRQRLGEWDDSE